jgi:nicotinate-nucleotide adenylyltransferase
LAVHLILFTSGICSWRKPRAKNLRSTGCSSFPQRNLLSSRRASPRCRALRLRMLRLALVGKSNCEIDEQELHRGGVSFSIDTVRDYARRFPGTELFYLIGADHVITFRSGARRRSGQACAVRRHSKAGSNAAELPSPFRLKLLGGFPLQLSSSQIEIG